MVIYIRRARPESVRARFARIPAGSVCMSVVTYGELVFGVEKSGNPDSRPALDRLTGLIPVLPMEAGVGDHYGAIRDYLRRTGELIGNNDLWIAAHARTMDLTLVTANSAEFSRVPNLKLENWAQG